jgi:hypothetical protein
LWVGGANIRSVVVVAVGGGELSVQFMHHDMITSAPCLCALFNTDAQKLPENVRASIRELEAATANCTACVVNICLRCVLPALMRSFCVPRSAARHSSPPAHSHQGHCTCTHPDPLLFVRSYGSRGEIVNACRNVAAQVQAGQLAPADIQEAHVSAALCASQYPGKPPPALLPVCVFLCARTRCLYGCTPAVCWL